MTPLESARRKCCHRHGRETKRLKISTTRRSRSPTRTTSRGYLTKLFRSKRPLQKERASCTYTLPFSLLHPPLRQATGAKTQNQLRSG
jgi:hypothetical protein